MIKEILNHKVFFKLRLRFIKCNYSANGTKKYFILYLINLMDLMLAIIHLIVYLLL